MAFDPSLYEARRRKLQQNFSSQAGTNAFANTLSQQRSSRALYDMNKQFDAASPRVVAGFGQRNLVGPNVKSGAFAKAMREFSKNRIAQTEDARRDIASTNTEYQAGLRRDTDFYNQDLKDNEMDKTRQIADDARQLLALRAGR